MTTSPALLASDQVNVAIDGSLPVGVARLPDLPAACRQVVGEKSSDAWHVVLNGIIGSAGWVQNPAGRGRYRAVRYTINVPLRDKHVFDTHVSAVRVGNAQAGPDWADRR